MVSRSEIPSVESPIVANRSSQIVSNFLEHFFGRFVSSGHDPDVLQVGNVPIHARVDNDVIVVVGASDKEVRRSRSVNLPPWQHVNDAISISAVLAVELGVLSPLELEEWPNSVWSGDPVNI